MTARSSLVWLAGLCWVGLILGACADPESAPLPCIGNPAACQAGSPGTGGVASDTGGSTNTGGTSPTGGSVTATGGVPALTGGSVGTGGSVSATGGTTVASGGTSALGGTTATGGSPSTGGTAGKASTGGTTATGGKAGTGGTSSGGASTGGGGAGGSTGGQKATGGTSTGGTSTGGTSTGGSAGSATGGSGGGGTVVELALGKAATAKGAQAGNPVANGNDGISTTRYCAADGATGNWWRVDLGAVHSLARVEIMWEFGRQYRYLVEVSSDDVSYTTAVDRSASTDTTQLQTVPLTASARYLRITATNLPASSWMSFFEVKVYGN